MKYLRITDVVYNKTNKFDNRSAISDFAIIQLTKNNISSVRQQHFSNLTAFNPLKPKLVQIIYKNSERTAKKTQDFTITKINWLRLFKEIIAVHSENRTKHRYKTKSF
jgi:hypothetical protein